MIKLITDTACLYSPSQAEKLGFIVNPLTVIVNNHSYHEFVDIQTVDLYKEIADVSLMEAVVSTISDQLKINRKLSTFIASACAILISFLPSLGYSVLSNVKIIGLDILDFMDFITNAVLMPIGALLTCIIVGYFLTPKVIIEEVRRSSPFKPAKLYTIVVKYFGPAIVLAVLISSVLNTFGIIKL